MPVLEVEEGGADFGLTYQCIYMSVGCSQESPYSVFLLLLSSKKPVQYIADPCSGGRVQRRGRKEGKIQRHRSH